MIDSNDDDDHSNTNEGKLKVLLKFVELFRGCELIKIYIEINTKIKGSSILRKIKRSMERMREKMMNIELDVSRMGCKK